jgi:hypothetical protein
MRKFLFEMSHGVVHLFLPLLDRLCPTMGEKLHDYTAKKAYPEVK